MNEIVNKFLLAGDRFMAEMHLRQPDLRIVLVDQLQKNKERIKKIQRSRRFKIYLPKRIR